MIGSEVVQIFGGICPFFGHFVPKNAVVILAFSLVTGPILIIFAHNEATILL